MSELRERKLAVLDRAYHCERCGKIPQGVSGVDYGARCPCGGFYHEHTAEVECGPNCPRKASKPRFYPGQKVRALVAPFGWEKALFMRHINGSNQIIRMDAATVDFVRDDQLQGSEWADLEQNQTEPRNEDK